MIWVYMCEDFIFFLLKSDFPNFVTEFEKYHHSNYLDYISLSIVR